MKHAMPRTPKTPVFGVQTTLDLFAAPTKPCAPAHKKSDNRPPVVTPRVIADDTAAAYDVWFDGTIGLKQVLENMGRSQVSTYFTWASDTHMAVTYYKKKTR